MFSSDRVVFLELHKTGCTHIRNTLKEVLGGEFIGKHNQASPELFTDGRIFLGSIRDPWEWYTSLWAYGCDSKGAVFEQVIDKKNFKFRGLGWRNDPSAAMKTLFSNSGSPEKWKRVYRDVNDAGAFREWLYMMHDEVYRYDFREGYGASSISKIAGLLTYRYMSLFCCKKGEMPKINRISTFPELVEHEEEHCFIDYFIRNESLETGVFNALEISGIRIPSNKQLEIMSAPKTNASSRELGPTFYYDGASENLVLEREKLIIDKFGYVAPNQRKLSRT